MKKNLALLLAGLMIVAMVPMNAFAASEARVNKVVTIGDDKTNDEVDLIIKDNKGDITKEIAAGNKVVFELQLENAKWNITEEEIKLDNSSIGTIKKKTDRIAVVSITDSEKKIAKDTEIRINLNVKDTTVGNATVKINPLETVVSATTLTCATVAAGGTTATICCWRSKCVFYGRRTRNGR